MNLLIHADPGARSGFLAAWLTDRLTNCGFDIGATLGTRFVKIHNLEDPNSIIKHQGIKIRIRPNLYSIDLHTLLFLRKNDYDQIPSFTKNEYSLETFTKLHHFAIEVFTQDKELNYSLYDYVVDFSDTYDQDYLIDLYKKIAGTDPTQEMINSMIKTNELNKLAI